MFLSFLLCSLFLALVSFILSFLVVSFFFGCFFRRFSFLFLSLFSFFFVLFLSFFYCSFLVFCFILWLLISSFESFVLLWLLGETWSVGRKSVNQTKWNMNQTLKHHLVLYTFQLKSIHPSIHPPVLTCTLCCRVCVMCLRTTTESRGGNRLALCCSLTLTWYDPSPSLCVCLSVHC